MLENTFMRHGRLFGMEVKDLTLLFYLPLVVSGLLFMKQNRRLALVFVGVTLVLMGFGWVWI